MSMSAWLVLATPFAAAAALAVPVPIPDMVELGQCEERAIEPLLNDSEPAPEAMPLRLVAVAGANLGTAELIGTNIIFYRAGDKTGTEQLTYMVSNARGDVMPGHVTVTIKESDSCS